MTFTTSITHLRPARSRWAPMLTLVLLAMSGCSRSPNPSEARQRATEAPVPVKTAPVEAVGEGVTLEVPGTIESNRRAVLTSRLAAAVIEFNPREGDAVQAGTLLVRFDATALVAAKASAEAQNQAASRDLTRDQSLFEKGAATRNEVERATASAARTRAALAAAEEQVAYSMVRAPFSGRVVRKLANAGDVVQPGQALVEIEGEGGLEVVASIDGASRERAKVGDPITVRVDGVGEPIEVKVRSIAPSADPSTHRFEIRANVSSRQGVRAGLFARVRLPASFGPTSDRRLLVPSTAVFQRGGLSGVYVIRDQKAWLRWIAPGSPTGEFVEALAGLAAGERVALDPSGLRDGASVSEARP